MPTKPTTADKPAFKCHERRHMSGAVYKTYDAIRAMAESAYSGVDEDGNPKPKRDEGQNLVFYGKVSTTLVNHTNTSRTQVESHINWLVEHGWLYKSEPLEGKRERNSLGHLAPAVYYVMTHEEFCKLHPEQKCPPFLEEIVDEKQDEPIRFQLAKAVADPAGRMALVAARLSGKLPGATFDEIAANLEKNPENMPRRVKK